MVKTIQKSFKSKNYKKIVKKLSEIQHKIKDIKSELFQKTIKNFEVMNKINDIIKYIKVNEGADIDISEFNKIKNNKLKKVFDSSKIILKTKYYVLYDNYSESNKKKNALIKSLIEKDIPYKEGKDIDILNENKTDIYKIIIIFAFNEDFAYNNIQKFVKLKNNFQIIKYDKIICCLKNKNITSPFDEISLLLKINFIYIYDTEEEKFNKMKENIENNNFKDNIFYNKFIYLIEHEIVYKFLINQYISLFNKSIYSEEKQYNKNQMLLVKISQDIQFLSSFKLNEDLLLSQETKNELEKLMKDECITEFLENFVNNLEIIGELENTFSEFEEEIEEKIKNNENAKNKENKNFNQNGKGTDNNISNLSPKVKKVINLINNNTTSNSEKINECEQLLSEKNNRNLFQKKMKKDNLKFQVFLSQIKDNILKRTKSDAYIVFYSILQKSIIHEFQKIFINNYTKHN